MIYKDVQRALRKKASKKRKETNEWFFKTGPGEYGEGDMFIGVSVPDIRLVTKQHLELPLTEIKKLFTSKIHEERLCAHCLLVCQFERGDETTKKKIYDFYLKYTKYINNWDLVDTSAHKIVGAYLLTQKNVARSVLRKLAQSKNLWERRIAIIATMQFIRIGQYDDTLRIAKVLLHDKHDLIHKAVGWMLREVGKKSLKTEEDFLKKYYKKMPRTMLRYAIEKFPETKRKAYLQGNI